MYMKECMKIRYTTKKEALSSLNYIRKYKNRKKLPIRIYYCNLCYGWHITSQNKINGKIIYEFQLPEDIKIVNNINKLLGK